MNEIELAIELFEDEVRILYGHGNLSSPESIDAHELALKLLRAELSRQENAPLTAKELEGMIDKPIFIVCKSMLGTQIVRKWAIPYMVYEGTAHCTDGENWYPAPNCHIYRYEPEGEKE